MNDSQSNRSFIYQLEAVLKLVGKSDKNIETEKLRSLYKILQKLNNSISSEPVKIVHFQMELGEFLKKYCCTGCPRPEQQKHVLKEQRAGPINLSLNQSSVEKPEVRSILQTLKNRKEFR